MGNIISAQNVELTGVELAKAPADFVDVRPYHFGTKLTFFVKDTTAVTGLTSSSYIKHWMTNTDKDLKQEHQQLASAAVHKDYHLAKDTALVMTKRDFWDKKGVGFSFKVHSWAFPDSGATSISVNAVIEYTVLEPGEVIVEDVTHLAGNIDGLTNLDFKGNTIDLKKVTYGRGGNNSISINGSLINKIHETAIQNMEFLDREGNVLDELYFGLNNQYNTRTKSSFEIEKAAVLRFHYRKLQTKTIVIEKTFDMGL